MYVFFFFVSLPKIFPALYHQSNGVFCLHYSQKVLNNLEKYNASAR